MPTTLFSSDKGHITMQAPDRTNPKVMEAATRDKKLGRLPAWIELQKPRLQNSASWAWGSALRVVSNPPDLPPHLLLALMWVY